MMSPREYTPFDARANHDGTMNIYADGVALPGGQGLTSEAVLRVLSRFARDNGTILLTTVQLNGKLTRDLVDGTGTAVPYYEPAAPEQQVEAEADGGLDEELLLAAMKTRGASGAADYEEPVYTPALRKRRVALQLDSAESIPDFDVEGDIRKAISARKAPANVRTLVVSGVAVGAAAVVGIIFYLLSGSVLA